MRTLIFILLVFLLSCKKDEVKEVAFNPNWVRVEMNRTKINKYKWDYRLTLNGNKAVIYFAYGNWKDTVNVSDRLLKYSGMLIYEQMMITVVGSENIIFEKKDRN